MDWRNRIGLYGSYFFGMAGIGFTLPYLTLFLRERGFCDRDVGLLSTLAALAGLAQFPIGLWSDRVRWRKPFLLVALTVLAVATLLLRSAHGVWLGFLVLLFAENGACRATVESLAGAEATHFAGRDRVGAALGVLRMWKPAGIVLTALAGGLLAESFGIDFLLAPLAVVQALAAGCALLISERAAPSEEKGLAPAATNARPYGGLRDAELWVFVAAMVLFHVGNAPGGVYLGPFLRDNLHAPTGLLPYAFVVSMIAWALVVGPAGWLADRLGRRPLLIAAWSAAAVRLALVGLAQASWQVLTIQVLDGAAQGLFAVVAAAWVTDRLADPRRVGQAQALVGSSLVFGSAVGPTLAALVVDVLHYRGLFGLLAGVGAAATLLVVFLVPETLHKAAAGATEAKRTPPDISAATLNGAMRVGRPANQLSPNPEGQP
jgi:MFS family permease